MTHPTSPKPLRLLLLGATGAVGSDVLSSALNDERFGAIVAPTRRPLPPQTKLINPVVDFQHLPESADFWKVDAVICALGTTIRAAGSQEAFAAVDRDLPIHIAQLARSAGATRLALNSSLGASAKGNFYLRTKAEAEAGLRALGFDSNTIVRPSLIDTERAETRLGESIGIFIAHAFEPIIPKRYRAVTPERIAKALLDGVCRESGERIVESDALQD